MDQTFKTEYGDVTLEELLRVYSMHKQANLRHQARRHLFNQTERGKQLNRERSKKYYYEHREEILQQRKEEYEATKS